MKDGDRRPIRWAIVAPSSTARKRMLPAMAELPEHTAILVVGRDPARTSQFQSQFSIPKAEIIQDAALIDSYRDVIERSGVDAAYISMPTSLHGALTTATLKAGKHVLCEKPMFLSPAELAAAKAACRNTLIAENYSYSHSESLSRIVSMVRHGEIGDLTAIETHFSFPAEERHRIRYSRRQGGGSFLDLGCYSVDLISRICDQEVVAIDVLCRGPSDFRAAWLDSPQAVIDTRCVCRVEYGDAFNAVISTSFEECAHQWVAIHGKGGSIVATNLFRQEGIQPNVAIFKQGEVNVLEVAAKAQEVELLRWYGDRILDGDVEPNRAEWHRWKTSTQLIADVQKRILDVLSLSGGQHGA